MAKKIFRKNRRSHRKSDAERTIEEGRDFIYKVDKMNKEKHTGRMRRNRVKREVQKRIIRIAPQVSSRIAAKKPKNVSRLPVRRAVRSKPAPPPSIFTRVPPVKSPVSSMPIATTPIRSASKSTIKNGSKITKFKSALNDDLSIPAFGFIDVCFCVDATGSMCGEVAQVQSVIESIIHNIESKVRTQGLQLRFAVVTYRDHPPQDHTYVTKIQDFTDNFQTIKYVKTLNAGGGGDEPQAVHDGLYDSATKLNWAEVVGTPVLRYIFHIADAPPHGKQFNNFADSKIGCLCGMQTDDVIREINKKCIHYRLIKVRNNPRVDKMGQIFKSKIGDYDETNISHASEMNVKVSDMIIHEVLPDYA